MKAFLPDFRDLTDKIEKEHGEKFEEFRKLLLEWNKKYNLTSITEEREVFYKHFLDSAAGINLIKERANVLEVGSGAGFPSLPLKILRDDLRFTLVESTGKKCEFLKFAAHKLGLTGITVVNDRAEALAGKEEFRERFDVCCARAVARLNTLAEYCMPFVKVGGGFLAYKGEAEEELKEAERAISVLGGGRTESVCYELPGGYGKRTLVFVEKIKKTPALYPRGNGKERRNPIS